jgi:4-hydroxythreonine-4-phosphate dehydrogenase
MSSSRQRPAQRRRVLAITPGDPAGVGPEIVWKALRSPSNRRRWKAHDLLCIGARAPFEALGARVIEARLDPSGALAPLGKRPSTPFVWLLPAPTASRRFLPGFQSGWSIEQAARLILRGQADALVTGPISKERLQRGGYPYVGHTDFLADLCGVDENFTMMLANDQLRISLVTTHLALKDVPPAITRERVRRAVTQTEAHLRQWWGIRKPRIVVAALNPHAGEKGILGKEEMKVIEPELRHLRAKMSGRAVIEGPLPADTLFAQHVLSPRKQRYDAVVCMYHDQGLIPVKLLDFPRTVNVTLGLPLVRTSVDHGVAFDIAGQGIADPSSFESAVDLAIDIVRNRRTPATQGKQGKQR